MAFSQYLATAILNWVKGTAFPAVPTGLYITIHDGNPGVTGSGSDVTTAVTGSGNRPLLSPLNLAAVGTLATGGFETVNTSIILITAASVNATPRDISYVGLWNSQTGGNLLYYDTLNTVTRINTGDLVKFDVGTFSISAT